LRDLALGPDTGTAKTSLAPGDPSATPYAATDKRIQARPNGIEIKFPDARIFK